MNRSYPISVEPFCIIWWRLLFCWYNKDNRIAVPVELIGWIPILRLGILHVTRDNVLYLVHSFYFYFFWKSLISYIISHHIHIISYHISYHITSHHIISYHKSYIISYHIIVYSKWLNCTHRICSRFSWALFCCVVVIWLLFVAFIYHVCPQYFRVASPICHQQSRLSLVQIMACGLFGVKLPSELLLSYCKLEHRELIPVQLAS